VLVLLAFLAGTAFPSVSKAATCSYTNAFIGWEVSAIAGPNSVGEYLFAQSPLRCDPRGTVVYDPGIGFGDGDEIGWFTQAGIRDSLRSRFYNMKIFEGFCRLHHLGIHSLYRGTVDGINAQAYAVRSEPYLGVFKRELHLLIGSRPKLGRRDAIGDQASNLCRLPTPRKTPTPQFCVGNPVLPGQGCKVAQETDYTVSSPSLLNFIRSYDSSHPYHDRSALSRPLGNRWRHNHDVTINPETAPNVVLMLRGDGQILHFHPKPGSATDWVSDADIVGLLQKTVTGWTYRDSDDAVETFDPAGRRLSRVERSGLSLTYSYVPGSDRLASIQDHFGRRLSFTYNADNLLTEITTPSAEKITYTYADGNLASVTHPDTHSRHYSYTSLTVGGQIEPALLTGLTDENATPYATWTYDPSALAASSEHAGGVDRHTFVYQKDATGKMTGSTVTNPLAAVTQYQFERTSSAPAASRRSASPSFPGSPAASPTTPATATS